MNIGVMGCRGDSRGLARQTEGFAKWLQPSRLFGVDMFASGLSPYENDWSLFLEDGADLTVTPYNHITEDHVRQWLRGLDVVIGAETFYRDEFSDWAKDEGVHTILQINPEFSAWWTDKKANLPQPDVFIVPTTWRMETMPGALHLPFPVDRQRFPFRLRTQAERFVHVSGHHAMADRAGTRIVLSAIPRIKSGHIVIRTQSGLQYVNQHIRKATVEHANLADPADLYADADVILLPRRYGGQNLIVNEALSSGCPVIMLNREPESSWGGVVTIPSRARSELRTKGGNLPVYDALNTQSLASVINDLSVNPERVMRLSQDADLYAQSISWDTLLPVYQDLLSSTSKL